MELDLYFKLINGSLISYASFNNEIFGEFLSNYSQCNYNYAANLNIKAVSFFTHPVQGVPKRKLLKSSIDLTFGCLSYQLALTEWNVEVYFNCGFI